jgi:hydrogenase expression/formation protein HypE
LAVNAGQSTPWARRWFPLRERAPPITNTVAIGRCEVEQLDFEGWACPLPLRDHSLVVMGHGGGGKLSADLVKHLFLPHFQNETLARLGDSAVISLADFRSLGDFGSLRLAISTDSFTVSPLFFPGGDIGSLAVHGTVNDLAMSGAQPLLLTAGFILEEGLALGALDRIATSMADACRQAGVTLIAGDTKVVDKGHGDGVYINTTGVGLVPDGVHIGPQQARPGDVVLVSGNVGEHGIAVMSMRQGLDFQVSVESDSAPLNGLVAEMLEVTTDIHVLRDPTRGGLSSALNEIAQTSGVGIELDERAVPIPAPVRAACEMLGLDPFYVANEGKLIAIVPAEHADALLARMRSHEYGANAARIGQAVEAHPGLVIARTGIGGTRVVDMLVGEQLPRIC